VRLYLLPTQKIRFLEISGLKMNKLLDLKMFYVFQDGIAYSLIWKIWCASRARVNLPHIANRLKLTNFYLSCDAQSNFWTVRRSFSRNSYGRYPKDVKFQNSEYEVHQVSLKDYGSQNFSFLAFKREAVGERQISSYNGAWQTENFFSLKTCF
jgi:hypothetical protein